MQVPADLKYSREHLWVRVAGGEAVVGITAHAQKELGDVVFVELPKAGAAVAKGAPFGVVESVKTVSDLVAPAGGTVTRWNEELARAPELLNKDPYGAGWLVAIALSAPAEIEGLMGPAAYEAFLGGAAG